MNANPSHVAAGVIAQTNHDALMARVMPIPECGCWIWMGAQDGQGYGRVRVDDRLYPAHRVFYEVLKSPIPNGLHLDHKCRVRSCVNPDHLEPVTSGENVLRGIGVAAMNAKKTHCPSGHSLAAAAVRTRADGTSFRRCLICHREQMKQKRAHIDDVLEGRVR